MTTPTLRDRTIGDYLDALGSPSADPGGGNVAGLAAALGAALGQMVIALTRDADHLAPLHQELQGAIDRLLQASVEDSAAYMAYLDASRLPKGTPEEKRHRRTAMQDALVHAAEVPLGLARTAAEVVRLLEPVVRDGSPYALSDAEIGVTLAETAVLGALANVHANLPRLRDAAIADRIGREAGDLERTTRARTSVMREILAERRTQE